jgi:putative protease
MIRPDLVCPAGTPAALRDAVEAGADAVYCGLQNATNARNFPGLNFTIDELGAAVAYAHKRGTKVLLAVNTFPSAGKFGLWKEAVDTGVKLGVDAPIIADIGVAAYASRTYPDQRLHLSVQAAASSPEAIRYYCREFGIKRVVLPRILTVQEIQAVASETPCELETFIFGNHGLMVEGRFSLTNYVTGLSTNMDGVFSPAAQVSYERDDRGDLATRLGEFMIDCFECGEKAGTLRSARAVTRRPVVTMPTTPSRSPSASISQPCWRISCAPASTPSRSKGASARAPTSNRWFPPSAQRLTRSSPVASQGSPTSSP